MPSLKHRSFEGQRVARPLPCHSVIRKEKAPSLAFSPNCGWLNKQARYRKEAETKDAKSDELSDKTVSHIFFPYFIFFTNFLPWVCETLLLKKTVNKRKDAAMEGKKSTIVNSTKDFLKTSLGLECVRIYSVFRTHVHTRPASTPARGNTTRAPQQVGPPPFGLSRASSPQPLSGLLLQASPGPPAAALNLPATFLLPTHRYSPAGSVKESFFSCFS